jgi:hypothetical protein
MRLKCLYERQLQFVFMFFLGTKPNRSGLLLKEEGLLVKKPLLRAIELARREFGMANLRKT